MNAGSNPASPKISQIDFNKSYNNSELQNSPQIVRYSFFFISLIPPFFISKRPSIQFLQNFDKKIVLKQSYMLLVWFYYVSFLKKKSKDDSEIKIASLPYNQRNFTLTKAPMAHKTRSKEQYSYGYFSFKISFKSSIRNTFNNRLNINNTVYFILLNRKYLPAFETNMFFLKYIQLFFYSNDSKFFNYYKFENK